MILSSNEIKNRIELGDIHIDQFTLQRLNPNSYNLRLAPVLKVYNEAVLDAKADNHFEIVNIPDDGIILEAHRLYLGCTHEFTETHGLVPKIDGRSSIGRLGIFVHVTAGFGDIGFKGRWTLEIMAIHPVRIYPLMEICQISYHTVCGVIDQVYEGRYQGSKEVETCKLHTDFPFDLGDK